MKTSNVYEYQNLPVSIISDKGAAVIVITAKDEVLSVAKSDLRPSKLVTGGVYSNLFIQASLGGLVTSPVWIDRNTQEYIGKNASIFVTPTSASHVKLADGIPFSGLSQSMRPNHTGHGKNKRYHPNGEASSAANPAPKSTPNAAPKFNLEDDGSLEIGEGEEGIVKKLTLTWSEPLENIDVDKIKEMFESSGILPEPDRITLQKGKETETYTKQSSSTSSVKKAYYGLTPVMSRSCPKCASMLMMVTEKQGKDNLGPQGNDKVYTKCVVCGYEALYEGSLPGQGVAGQTDPE